MTGKKIAVLGTGGTIAGTAAAPQDNIGYMAAQRGIGHLLEGVPGVDGHTVVAEQLAQVDSKDMSFELWRQLALRCSHWLGQPDVAGIVITHGTDTIEETAWFLHSVLAPSKPVVLTCAMRPATSLDPDGPQNIADAMVVAATPGARGVLLVCAGVVHGAADVTKVHHYRRDPFSSGDAGPIGHVEEARLRLTGNWAPALPERPSILAKLGSPLRWPRVEVVISHAGASGELVQALVAQGLDGLVVAGTGNGTVHQDLMAALLEAHRAGVRVVRASRCAHGRVIAQASDLLPASERSPVKARIDLLLDLLA